MRLTARSGHPNNKIVLTDGLLVDEERAGGVLDRRPRGHAAPDRPVVRRARMAGAQLHARRHAGRRRRAVLSLVVRGARHLRHRRGVQRALSRRDPVRPEEQVLRREVEARHAALVPRRREAREEDARAVARGDARGPAARVDAGAAARQPAFDHAGHSRGMARGGEAAGDRMIFGLESQLVLELVVLGCFTGFLAGLLGIGGGMLMVPFMTLLLSQQGVPATLSVKMAIATSMTTILFTSISSVRAHHRRGAVRWDLVRTLAPGIVVGGLLSGAGVFALLKGTTLALVFAVFVAFSASQMLLDKKPHASRHMPGPGGRFAAGGAIGFISGLVGAGGGFISVPFMTWCNVPMHNAVATSAALGFPIALANTVGYVIGGWSLANPLPGTMGYLWLPALVVIASASVVLAPLGAMA